MSATFLLVIVCGVMFGCGVYLLLARSVVRALLGFLLMSNGVNLMFMIASGPAGRAPILGDSDPAEQSDPVPQAMVLTAIVIGLCLTAFMLALAHRAWQVSRTDVLADDAETARIGQLALENDMSASDFHDESQHDELEDDALARTTDDDSVDDADEAHEAHEAHDSDGDGPSHGPHGPAAPTPGGDER